MTPEQFATLHVGQIVYDYGTQGDIGDRLRIEQAPHASSLNPGKLTAVGRYFRNRDCVYIFTADATGVEVARRPTDRSA